MKKAFFGTAAIVLVLPRNQMLQLASGAALKETGFTLKPDHSGHLELNKSHSEGFLAVSGVLQSFLVGQ